MAYKATTVLIKKYDQSHLVNKLLFCCVGLLVSTVAPIIVLTIINVIYPLEGALFVKIVGQALWIGIIVPIIVSWKKSKPRD